MAFGDRLAEVRRGHGLTQEQFAEQLQVSRQAVSKWESGRGYPEIEKILYICNRYHVSIADLFYYLHVRKPAVCFVRRGYEMKQTKPRFQKKFA